MRRILLLAAMLTWCAAAHAQGCVQCRDNTAAMPPATQAAYRHAILLLIVVAGGVFAGTVVMMKRSR